jgi:hypothetical protein
MFFFVRNRAGTLHSFLNVYRALLTDLNVYLIGFIALNVYLAGLIQYIFSHFFLYAMFFVVNVGNIVLRRHCWFIASCLLLVCSLISYLHVVVVLVCLLVLLQFARFGLCNSDWNCPSVVPH